MVGGRSRRRRRNRHRNRYRNCRVHQFPKIKATRLQEMPVFRFTELLCHVRSALLKYDEDICQVKKLVYWSGNEEHFETLALEIANILEQHELVTRVHEKLVQPKPDADAEKLRSVMIYLLVNSDNEYACKEEVLYQCNERWVHLVNMDIKLPILATIAIACMCGLIEQFNEFIACAPHWLTVQYFEAYIETLAHLGNGSDILPLMCGTVRAAIDAIGYFALAGGPGPAEQNWKVASSSLVKHVAMLLQRHLLNTSERLRTLRPLQRKLYLGEVMRELTKIMIYGFKKATFHKQQSLEVATYVPAHFSVYRLHTPAAEQTTKPHDPTQIYEAMINTLAHSLQTMLLHVNIDTFMHWQEVESADHLLLSLQEEIGNHCLRLQRICDKQEVLRLPTLRGQLTLFAQSAKTYLQRLPDQTVGELLSLIDGDRGNLTHAQLMLAINELLQRRIAYGNDECVESLARHIDKLGVTHANIIMKHLGEVVQIRKTEAAHQVDQGISRGSSDDEQDDNVAEQYESLLQLILQPIFKVLSTAEKKQLLVLRDQLDLVSYYDFEPEGHSARRILFFNNITPTNVSANKFFELCFENPKSTWLSMAQLAMAHTNFQTIYWNLARQCPTHALHYVSDTVAELCSDSRMLLNHNANNFLITLYNFLVHINSENGAKFTTPSALRRMRIGRGSRQRNNTNSRCRINLLPTLMRYNSEKLRVSQRKFLVAFANGIAAMTQSSNFIVLERMMQTLLQLADLDERHAKESRDKLQQLRQRFAFNKSYSRLNNEQVARGRLALKTAENYTKLHNERTGWRRFNWSLTAQMMLAIDDLRWDLTNFDILRANTLTLAVRYASENIPNIATMPPGFLADFDCMVRTLRHTRFWNESAPTRMPIINEAADICPSSKTYADMLIQSSQPEAKVIIRSILKNEMQTAVFARLSDAVVITESNSAIEAYCYIFESFVNGFKQYNFPPKGQVHAMHLIADLFDVIKISPQATKARIISACIDVVQTIFPLVNTGDKKKIIKYVKELIPAEGPAAVLENLHRLLAQATAVVNAAAADLPPATGSSV